MPIGNHVKGIKKNAPVFQHNCCTTATTRPFPPQSLPLFPRGSRYHGDTTENNKWNKKKKPTRSKKQNQEKDLQQEEGERSQKEEEVEAGERREEARAEEERREEEEDKAPSLLWPAFCANPQCTRLFFVRFTSFRSWVSLALASLCAASRSARWLSPSPRPLLAMRSARRTKSLSVSSRPAKSRTRPSCELSSPRPPTPRRAQRARNPSYGRRSSPEPRRAARRLKRVALGADGASQTLRGPPRLARGYDRSVVALGLGKRGTRNDSMSTLRRELEELLEELLPHLGLNLSVPAFPPSFCFTSALRQWRRGNIALITTPTFQQSSDYRTACISLHKSSTEKVLKTTRKTPAGNRNSRCLSPSVLRAVSLHVGTTPPCPSRKPHKVSDSGASLVRKSELSRRET